MPTKAEIAAENERLRQRLAELEGPPPPAVSPDIRIGESYRLAVGQAKVLRFYTEDGVEKVQMELDAWEPEDGRTPTGQVRLCSMPPDRFRTLQAQWVSDQLQREEIRRREAAKARRAGR